MVARTLRRLDLTARSLFALIEPGSCFAGTLFEIALAADRSYMLYDKDRPAAIATSSMNAGGYPMTHGMTRLDVRFFGDAEQARRIAEEPRVRSDRRRGGRARDASSPTTSTTSTRFRSPSRKQVSLSPDALTGMEASLRFPAEKPATARSSRGCPPGRTGFSSAQRGRPDRCADLYGNPSARVRFQENLMQLHEKIPNNVNLSQDKRLAAGAGKWQPDYLKWWHEAGPSDFQATRSTCGPRSRWMRGGPTSTT